MELRRVAGASTYIMFPVVDDTGKAYKSVVFSSKARYIAWSDTSEPLKWSFQTCAYAATYVGGPSVGVAQLQVAHTELPLASPYVMFVIEATNVATQYVLVNTATTYATLGTHTHTGATVPTVTNVGTVTGNVNGSVASVTGAVGSVTGAVGSVTADVNVNMGQAVPLTSATANTTGHVLAKVSYATHYLGGGATVYATLGTHTHTGATVPLVTTVTGNVAGNVTGSVGSVTTGGISSGSFAAGAIDAAAIAANAIGDAELAADGASKYADAFLYRNLSGGTAGGRDVRSALYVLRNKVDINSGVMTVYNTDDTGSAWTATVATGGTAAIITVDPG